MIGPREVFAEALSEVLSVDMDETFMLNVVDNILIRMMLKGYIVAPAPDEEEVE